MVKNKKKKINKDRDKLYKKKRISTKLKVFLSKKKKERKDKHINKQASFPQREEERGQQTSSALEHSCGPHIVSPGVG